MAGGQRSQRGGIFGLRADVLTDSRRRQALHYDLLTRGLHLDDLGTPELSWLDLLIFVKVVQREHNSALATELHGPAWSVESQLLAEAVDALNVANWQRAGRRSAPKPKRVPRPWEKPKSTTLGADPIPISKFNDWWDSKRAKRAARKGTKKPPTSM